MLTTRHKSMKIFFLRPYRICISKRDSWNVLILRACQNYARLSDVTSQRYSRFQGKMNISVYQFKDSLQIRSLVV